MFNLDGLTPVIVESAASKASTFQSSAVNLMTNDLEEFVLVQQIGAVTGTITGKMQDSPDGSTDWQDVTGAAFTIVSSANNIQALGWKAANTRGHIRYVGTIATGPALTSVTLLGVKKYR